MVGYHTDTMQKYTAWKAHNDDVRQLLLNEQGITSISTNNVRFYSREGKLQLSYSADELQDLIFAMWTNTSQSTFLIGSRQTQSMSLFDLRRGRVIKEVPLESSVTIMARNSRQVCVGHTDGSISLRDPRSYRVESTLKPHQTHVMAMDVKSDLLISCGYTQRGPQTVLENTIRVYDLRMARLLQSIRFDEGAFFLKFHPVLTSTAVAVSPSGRNVQLLDVAPNGGQIHHQWYLESLSQEVFSADFSSSGECLAFGDADGYTHLWSSVNPPSHARSFHVNADSHGLAQPISDRRPPKPAQTLGESLLSTPWISTLLQATGSSNIFKSMDEAQQNENTQALLSQRTPSKSGNVRNMNVTPTSGGRLAAPSPIGFSPSPSSKGFSTPPRSLHTPKGFPLSPGDSEHRRRVSGEWGFSREQPLSALDESLFHASKVPEPIDADLLKYMRMTSGIGVIATEPGTRKRNLARDAFRQNPSLQEVRSDLSSQFEEAYDDTLPPTPMRSTGGGMVAKHSKTPRPFRLIPAHHPSGRFGHFDYSQYNHTQHIGLEHIGPVSSRCNPMIQLLFHIPQVRAAIHNHLCVSEYCVMCELSFLFHMMILLADKSEEESSLTACPKNFLRCVRALPKASTSGLFDEEYSSLSALVEKFNRFLLAQLHDEALHSQPLLCEADVLKIGNEPAPETSSANPSSSPVVSPTPTSASPTAGAPKGAKPSKQAKKEAAKAKKAAATSSPASTASTASHLPQSAPSPSTSPSMTSSDPSRVSIIDQILGAPTSTTRRCSSCASSTTNQSSSFTFKLKCPDLDEDSSGERNPSMTFSSMFNATLTQHSQVHYFCERCETFQLMSTTQSVESIPPQLSISCDLSGDQAEEAFWSTVSDSYTPARNSTVDHWLPFYLRVCKDSNTEGSAEGGNTGGWEVQEFDKLPREFEDDPNIYELSAVVSAIKDEDMQHMVAQVRTAPDQWYLFNDFHVSQCGRMDAVHIASEWKTPCIVHYSQREMHKSHPVAPYVNPITSSAFYGRPTPGDNPVVSPEQLEVLQEELAIDAEFVLLKEEQAEDSHGGVKRIVSPNEFGVARVSLIGIHKSSHTEKCIMDDYIAIDQSAIVDYLTQFSGIERGDLDRQTSRHHVCSLKSVYLKLRYLVDSGHVFVGHGLSKDFSTINIVVPANQIIDTVTLFHLENQRMISLRFLASVLLGVDIQQTTHDSIEDSRTALQLYRKYQDLVKEGKFDNVLQEIYAVGRKRQWKVYEGDKAIFSASPSVTPAVLETP